MHGYFPVVEVGNTQIEEYVKKDGEAKQREIKSILRCPNRVLHRAIYSKNPEWFNQ